MLSICTGYVGILVNRASYDLHVIIDLVTMVLVAVSICSRPYRYGTFCGQGQAEEVARIDSIYPCNLIFPNRLVHWALNETAAPSFRVTFKGAISKCITILKPLMRQC